MNLISKEILMSHLQRSEGAEEVSLPIDFFRDLLYQAMPRTWVDLTEKEKIKLWDRAEKRGAYQGVPSFMALIQEVETKLKDKNL